LTTYYISPTGNDTTGTGSIALPWRTLSKFYGQAVAGDTLYCRGGTYSSTTGIYVTSVGTVAAPITVAAYSGEAPVFDGGSVADSFAIGFHGGAQYHVIDGLSFDNFRPTQFAVIDIKDTGTAHFIIRDCTFTMAANGGVTTAHAVYTEAYVDDVLIELCTFTGKYPSEATGSALEVYHSPGATNIIFRYNICDGWTRAVQLWDVAATASITHNTFLHSYDHIQAYNHSTLLVRDNAGDDADDANFTDPNNSADTTADHNFWAQTFVGYALAVGQTGKNAASDGSDAGAVSVWTGVASTASIADAVAVTATIAAATSADAEA
jgi:hypothetical protein